MELRRVKNEDRRFGSADHYFHLRVDIPGDDKDEPVDLLFTENDLRKAAARAAENPEDFMFTTDIGLRFEDATADFLKDLLGL